MAYAKVKPKLKCLGLFCSDYIFVLTPRKVQARCPGRTRQLSELFVQESELVLFVVDNEREDGEVALDLLTRSLKIQTFRVGACTEMRTQFLSAYWPMTWLLRHRGRLG